MLIPLKIQGAPLSVDDWLSKYKRECSTVSTGHVCKQRLDSALLKMKNSGVYELLVKNNLPGWIATVPVIESEYKSKSISRADARGIWQLMPYNIQTYFTKKRTITIPMRTGSGLVLVETIIETKPTIEACRELAKDIEISTTVASWLLLRLHQKYNDWELALMAYNAGGPRIDRYLKKEGPPLAFETENYFQQLMAIQKYIEGIQ